MQFQVPQFIESEDKIIGPLSLRQFAYVGVGAILSALLYFTVETWLWVIGSIIIFAAAFALAFVKIEGRPFVNVVISAFHFYWKPQTYVWQPEHPKLAEPKKAALEEKSSGLADILADSVKKVKNLPVRTVHIMQRDTTPTHTAVPSKPAPISRESVMTGSALHRAWEGIQTGTPLANKNSDKQFIERKMAERYQIFQKIAGDRNAAKRVDYR